MSAIFSVRCVCRYSGTLKTASFCVMASKEEKSASTSRNLRLKSITAHNKRMRSPAAVGFAPRNSFCFSPRLPAPRRLAALRAALSAPAGGRTLRSPAGSASAAPTHTLPRQESAFIRKPKSTRFAISRCFYIIIYCLSLFPCAGCQKNDDRHYFKSAQKHDQRQKDS